MGGVLILCANKSTNQNHYQDLASVNVISLEFLALLRRPFSVSRADPRARERMGRLLTEAIIYYMTEKIVIVKNS